MKYKNEETQIVITPHTDGIMFWSEDVVIHNETIRVRRGYEWDGCGGKKFVWMDIRWGVPDGVENKTKQASMIHSALYRHKQEVRLEGVTRKMADKIFYDEMRRSGFKLARLYYIVARLLGWTYGSWR